MIFLEKNEKDDVELSETSSIDTREVISPKTYKDWLNESTDECAKCFCKKMCDWCKNEFGLEIFCCLDCLMEGHACDALVKFMKNNPVYKNDACIICNKKGNKTLRYYDGKPYCHVCLQFLQSQLQDLENLRFLSLEKEFELLQDLSVDNELLDLFQFIEDRVETTPVYSSIAYPFSTTLMPWKEDGQRWHLNFRTQGKRAEAVIATVDLIVELLGQEPSWEQSQYIAFTNNNNRIHIARLETHRKSFLRLELRVKKDKVVRRDIRSKFRKLPKFTIDRSHKNFDAIQFNFNAKDELITPHFQKFMKYIINNCT